MNLNEKFLICLYSDANALSINILEYLLANNCYVNVITKDKNDWLKKTSKIVTNNRFSISGEANNRESSEYAYSIGCFGYKNTEDVANEIKHFLKIISFKKTKTLIVLPKEIYGIINREVLGSQENIAVVYVSDLLGPRLDIDSNLRFARHIKEILEKRKMNVSIGETFSPIFISEAARQIVKWLFAFGPYGKEVLISGPAISNSVFWIACSKIIGNIKLKSTNNLLPDKLPKDIDTVIIEKDLGYMLTETFAWVNKENVGVKNTVKLPSPKVVENYAEKTPKLTKQNPHIKKNNILNFPQVSEHKEHKQIKNISIKPHTPKHLKLKTNKRNISFIIFSIATVLLFPIILLAISLILVYSSYLFVVNGKINTASSFLSVNKIVSSINYFESKTLKLIPLLGQIYKETEYSSYLLMSVSDIGKKSLPLITTGEAVFTSVLQNNVYSVESLLSDSDIRLQELSEQIMLLEKKTDESADNNSLVAKRILSEVDFKKYNNLIIQAVSIVKSLPEVLGEYGSKNYMILFQNNMELRPTGGFIGSFGLVTLDKGRLTEFNVSDVYSADGQLKGHVEPPTAIKEYLNEANWWLRDSNWDPDFPISAKRVEWFLDKEIDKQVDGVIAIDLNPIKEFLKVSGSIYLTDYKLDINDQNLYENVQSEVQDNTFPGTHQKSSFLTALSRSILNKVTNIPFSQKLFTLKSLYKNLEERHVQIYIHNDTFQEAISKLKWDGSVFLPSCGENCTSDLVGIVEANVGVNKANYFINRSAELNIDIDEDKITKSLTLTLQNKASSNLGLSGIYKAYVRILLPEDASDIKVFSEFGQNVEELTPEINDAKGRKEIGVFLETYAGETKKLRYSWLTNIQQIPKYYSILIRKQAGVDGYPYTININTPFKIEGSTPEFTPVEREKSSEYLQRGYQYWYNTSLFSDSLIRLSI